MTSRLQEPLKQGSQFSKTRLALAGFNFSWTSRVLSWSYCLSRNGMESFFTGSVKSYRLISPAQLAHPGHGSASALHTGQLCDGWPESELY